jgi:hypothetical protein
MAMRAPRATREELAQRKQPVERHKAVVEERLLVATGLSSVAALREKALPAELAHDLGGLRENVHGLYADDAQGLSVDVRNVHILSATSAGVFILPPPVTERPQDPVTM